MVTAFAILLIGHGLIHFLGAAKAFGLADLPQLTRPVSPVAGVLWFVAGLLFVLAALSLVLWPRVWWIIAICAVVVSMTVIVPSWADAKFGALANGIVVVGILFGFLSDGPWSLRAEYERDVASRIPGSITPAVIAEQDLVHLPVPVQRYLRVAGVVGQPRIRNFRVRMHGRIRGSKNDRWMPFAAEQYTVIDLPARLFSFNASMFGIPVQGYHRYVDSEASMRVKAAALVPVVLSSGEHMTRSETVTLFNDMCIMAPGSLIDSGIRWEPVDVHTVRAHFASGAYTISADLSFDDAGELTNFVSDDRYQISSGGQTAERMRWSTPVGSYSSFGKVRLPSRGEGRWHDPRGEYAYIELVIDAVEYNVQQR